jgi:hypothetical protein
VKEPATDHLQIMRVIVPESPCGVASRLVHANVSVALNKREGVVQVHPELLSPSFFLVTCIPCSERIGDHVAQDLRGKNFFRELSVTNIID